MTGLMKALTPIFSIWVLVALASCGGGGGGGASVASNASPGTTQATTGTPTVQTVVTADPALPPATVASVQQVVSPDGTGSLGAALPISTAGPIAESLVYGLTSGGEILLASLSSSATTVLSADSTSLALVRIYLGPVGTSATASAINVAIRACAEFPNLVANVGIAVAAQTPPAQSNAVAASISTVLQQIAPTMSTLTGSTRPHALASQGNQIATPLPFSIVPDTLLGLLPVGVTGTCGSNCVNFAGTDDIAVVNNMPMTWTMTTYDAVTSKALSAPQLLPANASIGQAIFTGITGWSLVKPYAAKGNGGKSLSLEIGQNQASQVDNMANLVAAVLLFGVERGPNTCLASVLKPVAQGLVQIGLNLNAQGSGPLVAKDAFKDFFGSVFETASNVSTLLASCSTNVELAPFLKATAKLLEENPLGAAVKSAGVLGYQIAYVLHYWDAPSATFQLCEDATGQIQNCVASLSFSNSQLFTTLGVTVSNYNLLSASDAKGSPVGIPSGLVYSANDGGATLSLDATTGVATTIGASPLSIPTTVTVTDPSTGTSASYEVTVVKNPTLSPAPAAVDVGATIALTLTDGMGHALIVPTTGVDWESSDTTLLNCLLKVAGGLQCGGGTITQFSGLADGVATVTVTSTSANFSTSAQVQVGSSDCPSDTIDQLTVIANTYNFYSTSGATACFISSQYQLYVAALKALPNYSMPACKSIIDGLIATQSNVAPYPVIPTCP